MSEQLDLTMEPTVHDLLKALHEIEQRAGATVDMHNFDQRLDAVDQALAIYRDLETKLADDTPPRLELLGDKGTLAPFTLDREDGS